MPSSLGACVFVAVAAATPPPAPVRVATASELLAAIGPHRTIELAAGDFDLGATARTATAYVRWDETTSPVSLIVHDVDNFRIVGPSEGTARLYATASVGLEFRRAPGLELRRITLGRPARLRGAYENSEAGKLRGPTIVDSRGVTIDDVRTLAAGCSRLTLSNVDDARVSRFRDGGCAGIEIYGGRGHRVDEAHVRSPIAIGGAKGVTLAHLTVEIDADAEAGMASALSIGPDSEVTLDDVRLVDAVTGKIRRQVDHGPAPFHPTESEVPAEAQAAVGFVLRRSGPVGSDPDDSEYQLRLTLEDGRETFSRMRIGRDRGLDPSTLRAHRLGDGDSPILITWDDIAQGHGNYQSTFYQLVGPGPNDGPLLQGSRSVSGHIPGDGTSGGIAFAFDRGFLTLRGECSGYETSDDTSETAFLREWAYVTESIYRFRNGRLEAFRFEEYARVEPDSDLAKLAGEGYRPVWPPRDGSRPLPGEWLKRVLSIEDGEKAYPRVCSIDEEAE